MKSSQMGRWSNCLTAVFALTCAVAMADEPRLTPAQTADGHQHNNLTYSEPGPTVEGTRYFDGATEQLETTVTWRPMCGSDMGDMTPAQFAEFIQNAKAQAATLPTEVIDTPNPHGAGLNLVYTVSGAPPAGATAAITAVEVYLESLFSDNITVNIPIAFQNLGGGGVLGATGSSSTNVNYSTVRTALINGKDANDTLQDFLPTSSVPVHFDGATSTVTNVTTITVNTANYRAAIGANATNPDANMQININFTFDFDPTNGITAGQTCFRSVLAHETLHALGFVSEGDGSGTTNIDMLDLFRFQRTANNPSTTALFTTTARAVWTVNRIADDVNTDLISAEYRMSWGGSGNYQASHWRDQGGVPGSAVGIMNPAIASSVTFATNYLRTSDLAAMDAIGWDYPPPPSDVTPPTPNPMQFDVLPAALDESQISMTAVPATDSQNNTITYFFDYLGAGNGGNDSPWQSSLTYVDGGLTENTSFQYCVKARDGANPPVETTCSGGASAITRMAPPTGVNVTNLGATTCSVNALGTFTNLNLGSSGLYFNWVLTSGGLDVGNSGWTQTNAYNVTGLTPDTVYTFRAKARNQEAFETSTNQAIPVRTFAATPSAPTPGPSSVDVNPNGNPSTVLYAIQCVSTVPNDPAWLNQWVAFDGTPQSFEDFLTDAQWGVRTLQGLTSGVTYQFAVKAVNSDFFETPLGPPANVTSNASAPKGDCNGDGVFSAVTDTACFVDILIGVNTDPASILRSDVNNDAVTDGRDITAYVDCALTGCP